MGYANHQGSQRYATIGTVIGLHLLVGMVLVKALAPDDFIPFVQPNPTATIFTPEPTETPKPTATPEAKQTSTVYTDDTPFDLPTAGPTFTPTDENTGEVVVDPKPVPTTTPRPYVQPTPLFTPKDPVPIGNPANWATTNDYPNISIKLEEQGTSRFRLVVSSAGKVEACQVTKSSGYPRLDEATCKFVTRRAKFRAATDGNGEAVVGTYSNAIKWVLPD